MNKKHIKQEWFLSTEVLPSEIPVFFSNSPIKTNLETLINLVPSTNKQFNDKYTLPLNYKIPKNNDDYREISLIYPSSQLKFMFYMMKYEYLLLNFLQKSKYNVRKVVKANTITHSETKALDKERLKLSQDFGITGTGTITNEELDRYFKKYFAYNKNHKLSGIITCPSFHRDSLRYRFFSKLDIQNFFGSIYTHSITWAIVGDKHAGKGYSDPTYRNTFAAQSDIIQQKSNDNETNGILIGPEFNRIIADIVLTHCDYHVEKILNERDIIFNKDYKIYRFVDDYYIFSSNYEVLEIIEDEISKVLSNFNLKLNLNKHQIKVQPFSLSDPPIIQLKQLLSVFQNKREVNLLKLIGNDAESFRQYRQLYADTYNGSSYSVAINEISIKESAWTQLYDSIRDIVSHDPSSKRRVTLYFLKYISLSICGPIFIGTGSPNSYFFRYLRSIYTALDQINNIYSIHPDSDTTKAYISTMMSFRASLVKLGSVVDDHGESFITNSNNYIMDIDNKIFENIYRSLRNNSANITNISDLIVYSKAFRRKFSTQFLCQLLDENREDYFTLCAVGYYIIGQGDRYRVALRYLFNLILEFIKNYKTHTKSHLEDAKYFYILNDFIYYPEFNNLDINGAVAKEILIEYKSGQLKLLKRTKGGEIHSKIYEELMKGPYYNWGLTDIDFSKLQIQKILTDKNDSFDNY